VKLKGQAWHDARAKAKRFRASMAEARAVAEQNAAHDRIKDIAWADWIGVEHVAAEFIGDPREWPVAGWPAWIAIEAVDMPLVLIRSTHGGDPMWVNAAIIRRVWKQ